MADALALLLLAGAGAAFGVGTGGKPAPHRRIPPTSALVAAARPAAKIDRVRIPAGAFVRGSTRGAEDERPARTVTLSSYLIDRTEVTQAMYARCVAAGRCPPRGRIGPKLQEDPDLPMTNVSWHEARTFCAFAAGRLPSEVEWEKAARGSDGREYPWGAEADCSRANWGNFAGEGPCAEGKNPGAPVVVGSYPGGASPYGVLDLAGNVWEWVEDRYALAWGEPPPPRPARGDAGADQPRRVVRGGSCCSYFVPPRAANRNGWAPDHRDADLGFRCAAGPRARILKVAR
jgi:formylglycine-generating enzyme required for sulfatase activity